MKNFSIVILLIFPLIISTIGCLDNDDSYVSFTVWIRNKTNNTINGSVSISYEDEEILNTSFNTTSEGYFRFDEKTNIGMNSIKINILSQESFVLTVNINKDQNHHYFDVYEHGIEYIPPPIP